jgi:hypothetical protein
MGNLTAPVAQEAYGKEPYVSVQQFAENINVRNVLAVSIGDLRLVSHLHDVLVHKWSIRNSLTCSPTGTAKY